MGLDGNTGFRIPTRTMLLQFRDEPYVGLEVRAKLDISMATWGELGALIESAGKDVGQLIKSFERFADEALIDWNVRNDNDQPVPATAEGMVTLPPDMAVAIMRQWQEAVANPPGPLSRPSTNGAGSQAMMAQLGSLGDYSKPNSSTALLDDTDAPRP